MYSEQNSSDLSGGSFVVSFERSDDYPYSKTISYDNFDGDLADVELKIRVYNDDRIVCSERYAGQVRKR